ncbi:hypothetical protein C8Q73DRAFT_793621 [Cubamyces lactineus]|nr:hypothetical protein C8Q73DRAFT_793621 [Cubamyces lactineus]
MANTSGLPTGPPVPNENPAAVPRTPPPRTPSPNGLRELHADPPANSSQPNDSQATPGANNAQDTLPVPNEPFSPNDASPAGKKSYYQSRNYASVQQPDVKEKRRKLRLSMSGKTIIVEYDEFMKWFVPAPPGEDEPTDVMEAVDLQGVATTPEHKMYKPLVDALNQEWLLPNDRAISNPNTPDPDADTDDKIDAGLYRRSDVPMVGKKTRWAYMELSIECKTEDVQHDPFDESNPSGDHEDASATRQDILGQIMCYSGYIFDNQRRTHHFMLIIFGKMVRIIRWDRAGVVATKPFDYVAYPELLLSFIWRFARMTPAQRGHDPTATRIARESPLGRLMLDRARAPKLQDTGTDVGTDNAQRKEAQEATTAPAQPTIPGDHPRAAFEKSLKGDGTIWWRLRVDDAKGPRYFLVGKTHFRASGIAGRGTQTFVAVDEADPYGPLVYLKDAWRVAHTGIEQEGKILERLNSDDDGGPVPFVPTVRCHGDVEDQTTRSQEIWRLNNKDRTEEDCPLKTHRHYRLVVNEVGKPLTTFRNMKQLVGLVILCIRAHGEAYNRKRLIHRDISAGNVLIHPVVVERDGVIREEMKPLLADWELAKRIDAPEEGPRQPDRTGTWQFMSASALNTPSKRILVQDDMESFFHLLLYHAIRFIPHNCRNVGQFMDAYFDGHTEEDGVCYVGKEKFETMWNGELTTSRGLALCFYVPEELTTTSPPSASKDTQPSSQLSSSDISRELPQAHPINNLFEDFLRRLQAHYLLYVKHKADVTSTSSGSTSTDGAVEDLFLESEITDIFESTSDSKAPPKREITLEQRAELELLAAELASHKDILAFLSRHWKKPWPLNDRCRDQLPPNYQPNTGMMGTGKKKRAADATFETSAHEPKRSRASGV